MAYEDQELIRCEARDPDERKPAGDAPSRCSPTSVSRCTSTELVFFRNSPASSDPGGLESMLH